MAEADNDLLNHLNISAKYGVVAWRCVNAYTLVVGPVAKVINAHAEISRMWW